MEEEITLEEIIACCITLKKMGISELKLNQKTYDIICQKRFYHNIPTNLTQIIGEIKKLQICGVSLLPPDQIAYRGEVDTNRVYDRC